MINENKVAVMTRMAAYEAGDGKKNQTICSYFRGDYVGFQMLKNLDCCYGSLLYYVRYLSAFPDGQHNDGFLQH